MKIYRAIFWHNNADTCEWENWYHKASDWYSRRDIAEAHLNKLNQFKDYLINNYFKEYKDIFRYHDPYIEEKEVYENYNELDFNFESEVHRDIN